MKPVHAADRSKAPALLAPSWSWMRQAVAGKMYSGLDVAHMIRSMSVGFRFALFRAWMEALTASVDGYSRSLAMRRSRIPVISRIHLSLVSTRCASSSLVSTVSGTDIPQPVICAYGMRVPSLGRCAWSPRAARKPVGSGRMPAQNQRRVVPAEAERVGHDVGWCGLAGRVGHGLYGASE